MQPKKRQRVSHITDHFGKDGKPLQQILAELPAPKRPTIRFHSYSKSDGHAYLSNMFPCVRFPPARLPATAAFVSNDGHEFDSVERFYQFQRFLSFDEHYARTVILAADDARAVATASGKRVYGKWKTERKEPLAGEDTGNFDRDAVMREGLRLKFTQNEKLKQALLDTGEAPLEEIGRFDAEYWTNKGDNRLGQLLMELRDELRDEAALE